MQDYPSELKIREALIQRTEEFSRLTGTARTTISKSAVNDPAFLSRVVNGSNFTIGLYTRVQNWLDDNWPRRRGRAS